MRNFLSTCLAAAILTFIALTASAHDFEVDGICYNKNGSEATVTYYSLDGSSRMWRYSGRVVIPETVTYSGTTYKVTAIGEGAFDLCLDLTSVIIPNSVTSIGNQAFYCSGLKGVMIGNSVTTIGDNAFSACDGLTSVTIPNSVTYIGEAAFSSSGLTSVAIPNSVTYIGPGAFTFCNDLTSVTIGNSVTFIGNQAFSFNGLTRIDAYPDPAKVNMGWDVFCGVENATLHVLPQYLSAYQTAEQWNVITHIKGDLEPKAEDVLTFSINSNGTATVTGHDGDIAGVLIIPATTVINGTTYKVTAIGTKAFYSCKGLTSVNIPNSVNKIGDAAFEKCSGLTSVVIPNSVTSIGEYVFSDCSGLTSVTIPNSVTTIGRCAFLSSGLTSVTIPNSVTTIGERAFRSCSGLTTIIVESGNPNYDSRDNCNGIIETLSNTLILGCKSTTIPNSVISIGEYAFASCSGLTSVTIPNSVSSIGEYAFAFCSGLTSVTIGNSVTNIGASAFESCSGLTSVTIPNSVTSIGQEAFWGCNALTNVIIGNSVTTIDGMAFGNCTRLASVTIGNSVTTIGDFAFINCTSLTSVTIPNSVNKIGDAAFFRCSGLTSVIIGKSVTMIDDHAFYECSGLMRIDAYPNPEKMVVQYDAFYEVSRYIEIHVLPKYLSAYQTAPLWREFLFIIGDLEPEAEDVLTFSINSDDTATITGHDGDITGELIIPATTVINGITYPLTSIGNHAFEDCSGLTSVTIPNSVTSIGDAAFGGCTGLTRIDAYPDPTKVEMGADVFYNVPKDETLHVLPQYLSAYQTAEQWNAFYNIQADLKQAAIEEVRIDELDRTLPIAVYNLNGVKVDTGIDDLPSGIYIVRQGNKTAKIVK